MEPLCRITPGEWVSRRGPRLGTRHLNLPQKKALNPRQGFFEVPITLARDTARSTPTSFARSSCARLVEAPDPPRAPPPPPPPGADQVEV